MLSTALARTSSEGDALAGSVTAVTPSTPSVHQHPSRGQADVDDAIEMLLRDRQAREVSDLLARQYSERTDALRVALEELFERRREARAGLAAETGIVPQYFVREQNRVRLYIERVSLLAGIPYWPFVLFTECSRS